MNRPFHHLFGKRPPGAPVRAAGRPHRTCLRLEALEDRCVPSTFNVNTLADLSISAGVNANGTIKGTPFVTVRSAIEAANATPGSNTINLTLPGTYKIAIRPASLDDTSATENNATGDFDIIPNAHSAANSSLTITNTSGGFVAVSGNSLDRVFDINPNNATPPAGFTVVLTGFTVENGIASSPVPGPTGADGGPGSGGGIRDQNNVNLTLNNMVVTHNSATGDGGGLVMFNADNKSWTLRLNNTVVRDNHAGDAGGGIDTDGTGTVLINNSTVSENTDINQGAGIYVDVPAGSTSTVFMGANMTLTNSVVSDNRALANGITASGGGISNAGNGKITIADSTISGNFSGGQGGGFSDENGAGTLVVRNSLFLDNSAILDGGALQEGGPSTMISRSEFVENSSGATGGALFANGTMLTLQSSTFAGNTSVGNGGGIEVGLNGPGTSGTITNVTLTGNQALNNAGASGGGLAAQMIGSLALQNVTINDNFATTGGGVFWDGSGTFSARNTLIAANVAVTGPDADSTGTFTDNGGNLIGVAGMGSGNNFVTTATTQTGTTAHPLDPLLGPLQNNGGPTVGAPGDSITLETEAPLPGSPAIGKGILTGAPATDERGFPSKVNGKVNVGAVSQA